MAIVDRVAVFSERILKFKKWTFSGNTVLNSNKFLPFCSKSNIPQPPKRPSTAYMIFCKENRQIALKENPGLKSPEVIKILAGKWSLLTPMLRKPYEEKAREDTITYGKEHKEFYESLTEEQRDILLKLKAEKRESRKILRLKRALREAGLPKQPNSAYAIFIRSRAKEINVVNNGMSFIKESAEEWRNLSELEKEVFHQKAKSERESFEKKLAIWQEQDGHKDLLQDYNKLKRPTADTSIIKKQSSPTKKSPKASDDHAD